MKKSNLFFVMVLLVLTSCYKESDWASANVSPDEIVFVLNDNSSLGRVLAVPIGADTLFIENINLVYKVCYLKTAFPEESIVFEYIKVKQKEETTLVARFIKRENDHN